MWMVNALTALPPGKRCYIHCTGGWVGPRAGLESCGRSHLHWRCFRSLSILCPYLFVLIILAFCLFVLTVQYTTQTSMPPAGSELAIPASARSQTLALERSATGIYRIRFPDAAARSESLYRLSYPGLQVDIKIHNIHKYTHINISGT